MDHSAPNPPKKRRHSKACTRCRKRKIRCDFQYPACGACSAAGAECLGFDSIHGVDKPRSTISHLEDEVASLEIALGRVKSEARSMSDVANVAVEKLTTSLATTILEPRGRSRKNESLLPLTSPFFLSSSPMPYLSRQAWDDTGGGQAQERTLRATAISSIPRHIIDIMLKNYCEMYRPRYPAIEESYLYEACDRVCNNTEPSDFDFFCVYITLAISTNTLMYHDEKRATTASCGFWAAAVGYLGQIGLSNSWERLQALQLLTHYGFLNPEYVDCSSCAAVATRLCLQLGLHHELPPSAQTKLDDTVLNIRRKLFWNSYSIDSAVHTVRCRPFLWPTSAFTVKFPVSESNISPGIHVWLLRQIESEVTLALYYPSLCPEDQVPNMSFDQWFTRMHERLNEWHQVTRQSVNLTEKIEFHELFFHIQMLRLNRPSPQCPNPTKEMRKKALKSSIALIKDFSVIDRLGKLFNVWHASYFLVESGVCLLASVLTGIESPCQNYTCLEGEDVVILTRYVKTFPYLLWRASRRWSNIAQHASALEAISISVLEKLQQWARDEGIEGSELAALKEKLNGFGFFSPLPVEVPPLAEEVSPQVFGHGTASGASQQLSHALRRPSAQVPFETLGNDLHSQPHYTPVSITGSSQSIDSSNFQLLTTEAASFSPPWAEAQPNLDNSSSMFPEHYDLNNEAVLQWDFEGMTSEDIFAALLEGGEIPLVDEFASIKNLPLPNLD